MKTRDPVFDVLKALMMIWVLWGHLALYKICIDSTWCQPTMENAKIAVNMPVFFVISGFLAANTFVKATHGKLIARIIGFVWPQIVVGLLFAICLGGGAENF